MKEQIINTPKEMKDFAARLARQAKAGDIFCLSGDLGAGKTTFAQGFIDAIKISKDPVTSPTFNIVQLYKAKDFMIYHCDFYRLKSAVEIENLGLDDAFITGVTLIEWPEIAAGLLPKNVTSVKITTQPDGSRKVDIA